MSSMNLISNGQTYRVQRESQGLYLVESGERLLGFIERAGDVYVALSGTRYDRAVETGQAQTLGSAAVLLDVA